MSRDENGKRKTKKTKAKRNGDLHGKFTSRSIRKYEVGAAAGLFAPDKDKDKDKDKK